MPSPFPDKPGLLIRDPFHYSDATLIFPPALISCLELFDGQHTDLDQREYLVRVTGDLQVGELEQHLKNTLSGAAFLEDENFAQKKAEVERAFANAPVRSAVHAGSGYPDDPVELTETLQGYMGGELTQQKKRVIGIAAPHVSPFGGIDAYRAAYSALSPEDADRTFVVLGTSHYGQPDRIGLTRKAFRTPFGETLTDTAVIDALAREAGDAAVMEDYCHAVEHSIEFQVVFLQHLFGPQIRVVPVLCGSYGRSFIHGGLPEQDEGVRRTIGALGELAAREGDRLLWVLGVDMAHMGRRYGDPFEATAGRDEMEAVAGRDQRRISCIESGDSRGFWELVQEHYDPLKWCGSGPFYAFLRAVPGARGSLMHYQQWNIDQQSVVSFAGMRFDSST
jgi:AmmeMemoRadiSam system protein B